MRWNAGESGLWARILTPVLRHPLVSAMAAAGLLVCLAIPAFSIHTATPGVDTLPQDLGVIKTYNKIQKVFPGGPIPAVVAVSADERDLAAGQSARSPIFASRPPRARCSSSRSRRRQSRPDRRGGRHPPGRGRQRLAIERRAGRAARHI